MDVGKTAIAVAVIVVAVAVGFGVAVAASTHAAVVGGVPVPLAAFAIAFAVQWVAFVPAYIRRTEHFYDLTGSLTYLAVVWLAFAGSAPSARGALLAALVTIWAARLGTFLFRRVRTAGKDGRFDEIKQSVPRFLVAWTLQGLWVFLTAGAAIAAISADSPAPFGALDVLGALIWLAGFAIEAVADRQKSQFKAAHPDRFIDTGLWAWSRHPNYFGEIVLWCGVAVIAASTLQGWQWVTMISPVFVALLLTKISGIPLLEERSDRRWGADAAYQAYKARTPVLVLRPPR